MHKSIESLIRDAEAGGRPLPQVVLATESAETGVPEAGFISLTVVLSTLGYPTELLPLLLTVDWLLARARSSVNVLSDMTVSIALDALNPPRK